MKDPGDGTKYPQSVISGPRNGMNGPLIRYDPHEGKSGPKGGKRGPKGF